MAFATTSGRENSLFTETHQNPIEDSTLGNTTKYSCPGAPLSSLYLNHWKNVALVGQELQLVFFAL